MRRKEASAVVLALASAAAQTGCVFVGGYSSEGGWYVWPGSIVLTAVGILLLWLLARRRRR